ncbi:MAG: hypothetical protein AAB262_01625 [Elusimicrobiota bacterium]
MIPPTRRAVLLAILAASVSAAAAVEVSAPRVLLPGFGAGFGAVAFTLSGMGLPTLPPSLPMAAPLFAPLPSVAPIVAAAPVAVRPEGASALEVLRSAAASYGDKKNHGFGGRQAFDGLRQRAASPAEGVFVVNDEGVQINNRAAAYYEEVRRMVDQYKGKLDLSESLDVMDDAYGDVLAKVSAVEAVAKGRGLSRENTHLEETLVWVDGVLSDGKKKVAVHTHRVFFHHAQNPQSEIREGIRRVDGYIKDAEALFARGGKAESQMGRIDEIALVFDARGHREIKDHLRRRGSEVSKRTGGRIAFKFLDELAPMPKEQSVIRAKLNDLVKKYQGAGLSKLIEGVIYSRYVGLLLELKTLEHYHKLGYKILQSGRELFDAEGLYVSELDVVVLSPEGKVIVVEAKSARVGLPNEEILKDKIVYKLETYKKFQAQLNAMIGRKFDAVVFSMDVAIDPETPASGRLTERDMRKLELVEFLRAKEGELSRKYGFPVSFLFLQSGPPNAAPARRR